MRAPWQTATIEQQAYFSTTWPILF